MQKYARKYQKALKQEVVDAYGGACACCSITTLEFLAIHHKNRDGYKEGKKRGGYTFYLRLKREGFPKGFEPLCHNCNMGIESNRGICPHKENK